MAPQEIRRQRYVVSQQRHRRLAEQTFDAWFAGGHLKTAAVTGLAHLACSKVKLGLQRLMLPAEMEAATMQPITFADPGQLLAAEHLPEAPPKTHS